MAIVNYSIAPSQSTVAFVAQWPDLFSGDTGQPLLCPQFTDKSVQVFGTFGGATLRIEGSNDGTNWAPLHDPQGYAFETGVPKLLMVGEATLYIRPIVIGGDLTTDLTVVALLKE